jgi:4-amino-4-deoxy-L-arabinose transferase-like glycosyltransferase
MAQSGDWITPRLWGSPWFEKPSLLYWLIASATLLGVPAEWAVRGPVALLSIAFLVFYRRELEGLLGPAVAASATLILATSAGWLAFSQVAVPDLPLAATYSVAMLFMARYVLTAQPRVADLAWAGVFFGLAVLAKAAVPVVLAAPLAFWARRHWVRFWIPIAVAAPVALPWYVLCYRVNGRPFIDELFLRHQFARFTTGETLHAQPWWFYLPVLALGLFPWTLLLPTVLREKSWTDSRLRFFTLWLCWGLLFFSLSAGKLPGYLLPLLPAAAVLVAAGAHAVGRSLPVIACAPALQILALPILLTALPSAVNRGASRANWTLPPNWIMWAIFAVLAAGAVVLFRRRALVVAGLIVLAALAYAKPRLWTALDESVAARSEARTLGALQRQLGNPAICFTDLRRTWEYGLNYYLPRPLQPCGETTPPETLRLENGSQAGLILRGPSQTWVIP